MKIGIIDTGVNLLHPKLINKNVRCKLIDNYKSSAIMNYDQIGHGTAMCGIILEKSPDADVTVFKVFDNTNQIDENRFIHALEYVANNEDIQILNISSGISSSNNITRLENVCKKIYDKGIIIVASFNDYGSVTYPAAFPFVIGVDWDPAIKFNNGLIYCSGGIVNVYAKGYNQKVYWSNGTDYIVNAGASFAAAHVTAFLASCNLPKGLSYNEVLDVIKAGAIRNIVNTPTIMRSPPSCKKIALFPFNKEIISITNYSDMLKCSISSVFDIKQHGNIGKTTDMFSHRAKLSGKYSITNIDDIDNHKDSFDTLILGHQKEVSMVTGVDYMKKCINFCVENQKSMWSFDMVTEDYIKKFKENQLTCYNTNISEIQIESNRKLRIIGKPILTVAGTSSRQGKFSLQLELKSKFTEAGYSVGQWTSEPQGYLFGMDSVFPLGYGSYTEFSEIEILHYINNQLHQIEIHNYDIIITGTQSHIIPNKLLNSRQYPVLQTSVISALQPDVIILVVNVYDSINYITRTINFLQSVTNCKVACLALSHNQTKLSWSPLEPIIGHLKEDDLYKHCMRIAKELGLPCFGTCEIDAIVENIINYLAL